jgi:DNA (cytosine-5)-methyltransferase 1
VRYLSVCSGIEAASVAWNPLGWEAVAFSEIEKFPSAVLAHHYPHVPNWGDMTRYQDWDDAGINVLVGGTPCQSFSVAGLRKGLDDPRGNLMLTYGAIAQRYRPRWLVWENVPGVLSSDSGRDFGTFLGMLAQLGYGFAYRVLDAQYVRVESHARAVPQRRRRVFVIGCLGDWRRAAAVLFEPESMRGDSPPSRQAGEGSTWSTAPCVDSSSVGFSRVGDIRGQDPVVPAVCGALSDGAHMGGGLNGQDAYTGRVIPVAHALRADGFDASEDGTGRGTPLVPIAFAHQQGGNINLHTAENVGLSLQRSQGQAVMRQMAVRRLTPLECERLQGFPDDYTNIPKAKDGPRYKALGNSMAVNCMSWIGQRIQLANEVA